MLPFPSHKALDAQTINCFEPPISILQPNLCDHGLIFASPHSGHIYPKGLTRRTRLPLAALRRNEDAYIDKLISPLYNKGYPVLLAHFPRCFVDVNRGPDELLPEWTDTQVPHTPRAAAGLGVVPTKMNEYLPIYKSSLPKEVVAARLEALYWPYHNALKDLMQRARRQTGIALLLDCHSMPGASVSGRMRHDIVLGDRFGASADPAFVEITEQVFKNAGYSVKRNYPYAGGYVTSTYGQPHNSSHVIQIEINRQLYMNPASLKLKPSFSQLQACFAVLAETLRAQIANAVPRAAE